jgi:hypothetical protein
MVYCKKKKTNFLDDVSEIGIDWVQQSRFSLITETDFILQNVVFLIKLRR